MINEKNHKARLAAAVLVAVLSASALTGCHQKNTETMNRAAAALEQGDYHEASALYEAAVSEGKNLEASYRGLGIAQMGMLEYGKAAESFETALASRTQIEKLLYGHSMEDDIDKYLVVCYTKTGEIEKATALYDKMIESDDDNPALYVNRGTAYAANGDVESAKRDFDRAINLERNNYERLLQIAQILEESGRKDLGMAYLQEVPSLDTSKIDPLLKGRILYFLEDYEEARDLLLTNSETNEETALIVCKCYQALNDTAGAMEYIESYGDALDSSPSLLGLLGSIYMQREEYENAVATYERAVSASEGTDLRQEMLFNRIVAYEYAGNFDKAKEYLLTYLEDYPGDEDAQREMQFLGRK